MGQKVGQEPEKERERAGGRGERDERIYSEDEAKGECGPLVVTELFCVSVEKTRREKEKHISSFRRLRSASSWTHLCIGRARLIMEKKSLLE